ncbi:MAG: hypothetical protein A2Y61_06880 [Chloroflexi bacterium RBG_13_60_13]|nr:MAG: hypothetical protein A2Y61_06880 [Chloroflexi bacterium RBG_13_60_13]
MLAEPKKCLDGVRRQLKLAPSAEREILCELYTHFEDRAEELEASGLSEEEAAATAAREFGSLTAVVGELNEVHGGSTWPETLLAAFPHISFALLFALHQWSSVGWLTVIVLSVIGVVVQGWRRGRPTWFFTWLGYALIPLLAVGLIIMDQALDRGATAAAWWLWAATAAYFGAVGVLFAVIMAQILKRDWLLGSLTILPFLAVIGWFFTAQWRDRLLQNGTGALQGLGLWIALSLLTLAGIVILFTQLRKRWLKVAVLLVAGLVVLMLMTLSSGGGIGLFNIAVLGVVALFVLLGPAAMERWVVHGETEPWDGFLEERYHH